MWALNIHKNLVCTGSFFETKGIQAV